MLSMRTHTVQYHQHTHSSCSETSMEWPVAASSDWTFVYHGAGYTRMGFKTGQSMHVVWVDCTCLIEGSVRHTWTVWLYASLSLVSYNAFFPCFPWLLFCTHTFALCASKECVCVFVFFSYACWNDNCVSFSRVLCVRDHRSMYVCIQKNSCKQCCFYHFK